MGLSIKTSVILMSLCGAFVSASSYAANENNQILERLERGQVISTKTGSSFFVQALIKQDSDKVQAAFANLANLPAIFPQIAFATPYTGVVGTEKKQLLYVKLRGLGDGLGVIMEVKSGASDAFQNAKELMLSAENYQSRDTALEVDISKEANQLILKKSIDDSAQGAGGTRTLGSTTNLILEGPLNEVMELPNVRITLNLGVASYTATPPSPPLSKGPLRLPAQVKRTYLVAKVSFGNQVSREQLGDYLGFGERRLSIAEQLGANAFSLLRGSLEKL